MHQLNPESGNVVCDNCGQDLHYRFDNEGPDPSKQIWFHTEHALRNGACSNPEATEVSEQRRLALIALSHKLGLRGNVGLEVYAFLKMMEDELLLQAEKGWGIVSGAFRFAASRTGGDWPRTREDVARWAEAESDEQALIAGELMPESQDAAVVNDYASALSHWAWKLRE